MAERIRSYKEVRVYKHAMDAAMENYEITKRFPIEERYSLQSCMIDDVDKWLIH